MTIKNQKNDENTVVAPQNSGAHEVIVNKNGTTSLRHIASGEVMHSSIGPKDEATLLYVEQSKLAERLVDAAKPGSLVLFDVGLGAATNALAALQCHRAAKKENPSTRFLELVSFEKDISGLALAFAHHERFPFFEGYEQTVAQLLEDPKDGGNMRVWENKALGQRWTVYTGSYLEVHALPSPEVIFFDMYSPRTCPDLWSVAAFTQLRALCRETTLYTYSSSTRVRVALLLAGFFVGYGRSTGAKYDTTTAATLLGDLERPLDARWIERLKRSHAFAPYGDETASQTQILEKILGNAQFREPTA